VILALDPDYPLLDLFWTMLMAGLFGVFLWTLVVVFRDLYGRSDLSAWGKAGWTVLVLVLPLFGSLGYLVSRSDAMVARTLQESGASPEQMDAYVRTVTGAGGYHHVHETITSRDELVGPTRQGSA
jgi:hypothetical protein